MPKDYAPFPIVATPAKLGLQAHVDEISFGKLWNARRSERFDGSVSLFMHGVGGDWSTWTPLIQQMALGESSVGPEILVDIPGFGRSENVLGHLDATVVGRELLDWCTSLGATDVRLIGHSMGGFLALDMASRGDPRISRVDVVSGTYLSVVRTYQHRLEALRKKPETAAIFMIMQALALMGSTGSKLVSALADTPIFAKFMGKAIAHPEVVDPSVLKRIAEGVRPKAFMMAAANGADYDCVRQWNLIPPKLHAGALFGEADRLVPPSDYEDVRRAVRDVACEMIQDAGHFAHIERPAEVAAWLCRPLP